MYFKCCVPRCRGNYDDTEKVHVFGLPKNEQLQKAWIKAIPRKEFAYSKNTKKKSFMTCGGKDCKSLTSTLLKKLLTDDVAENFSLTGRSKTGEMKKSFEKTETYKLIIATVCRKYSGTKENSVREAICEWLIQSKHRKERREKRNVNRKQEEDHPPLPADSDSLTFRDIV